MKKFIIAVLLALAPSFAFADTGGGIAGAVVGVGLGSLIGHGNGTVAAQVVLGLAGASMGSRIEDGTYGRRGAEVVYVEQPQDPRAHRRGWNEWGEEMCEDPRSGGRIHCHFLAENPRYGCCGIIEHNVQPLPHPALYSVPQQVAPAPQNMWERPEHRQRAEQRKYVAGPTVDNYLDDPMVESKCKTGNYGHDGRCLLSFVPALVEEQRACGADGAKCRRYNSGKWAGIYQRLGNDLLARQREEQGSDFATR